MKIKSHSNIGLKINTADYKIIELPIDGNCDEKIISENLENIFKSFSANDIKYNIDPSGTLKILLSSLNLDEFKKTIYTIHHEQTKKLFKEIITAIEKIKSYGIKGKKRVYVGYNAERKVSDRKNKEGIRVKKKIKENFSDLNVDIPQAFTNKIICGDSLEVLKKLPDNCIDLIFTSPPYNFGLEYEGHNDTNKWDEYFNTLFNIFDQCIRVLKHSGRIVVNIQPLFSDYIPSHHVVSNFFLQKGLLWKGEILWEKNNYNCKYTSWGSWKSPSSPYLKYTWEFVEIFCKSTLKKEGVSANADISGDEFKKWVVAKWSIAPERKMKEYGHPAMFPQELAERVIKLFSFKNDIVLDPFNGVGTTCFVAKQLERRYLGIDISKEYCNISEKRIKDSGSLF